jgi:hypothetical protein
MSFLACQAIDVDHQTKYTCDSVKGTRDLNCVQSISIHDVNKMLKKDLSCFYCVCLNCNYKYCMNLTWTKAWQVEILNINNSWYAWNVIQSAAHEDEWDQFWTLFEIMFYQTGKINQKKPIFNNHQKGHPIILDTSFCTHPTWPRWFCWLVLRWHFWLVSLTTSQIEQFH